MNNLIQKLIYFVRNHPYRSLFIVLSVLVVIGVILRILYPPQPEVVTQATIKTSQFATIQTSNPISNVTITTQQLPTQIEAKVYSLQNYVPDNELLAQMAKTLQLNPSLYSKYAFTSRDGTQRVILNDSFKVVDVNNTQNETIDASRVSLAEAVRATNIFFTNLKLPSNELELDETKTEYWSSGIEPSEVSPEQASSIVLYYQRKQDNLTVGVEASAANFAVVTISSKGAYKATIPALFFSQTERESISLLPLDTAITQIKQGNYFLLGQINNPITFDAITSRIVSLSVTEVTLEYRIDEKQQLLLPFYHLTGTAAFETGEQAIPISLITPAFSSAP